MSYSNPVINDCNVMRYRARERIQVWTHSRAHEFDSMTDALNWIRGRVVSCEQWKVHMGTIEENRQVTLVVAGKQAARVKGQQDRIGRCVCKGTLEEVWPVFESYARML